MSAPALFGSTQPSAQTLSISPAQPWPRARCCARSNCKIAVYSAWDLPPLHAFGNRMDHMMGALGRRGEGSWRVLIFSRGLARRGGRKAGNDLPDYQHKFSRDRKSVV